MDFRYDYIITRTSLSIIDSVTMKCYITTDLILIYDFKQLSITLNYGSDSIIDMFIGDYLEQHGSSKSMKVTKLPHR